MRTIFETFFLAVSLAFTGWLIIVAGVKFEVKVKGQEYGFTVGGENRISNEIAFLHQSNYISRDWSIKYLSKSPTTHEIITEIMPRISQYITGYDSVYVTLCLPQPELISSEYTIAGRSFLLFNFFSPNKNASCKGVHFDPEGNERLKYLGTLN